MVACELLAVHQAGLLGAALPPAGLVDEAAGLLPPGTVDRPFGRDIDTLTGLLRGRRDQASG